MVRGRGAFDPADAVVWTAAGLLALLCGLGMGFILWSVIETTGVPAAWRTAIYFVVPILGIVAPIKRSLVIRLFVGLAAGALLLSFCFGSSLFSPLLGS
ncbi:MAG: hypothetical protein ACYC8W_11615 [Candidatus Tyrphobacter sp.]